MMSDELFELPEGWEWTKLSDVLTVLSGEAFKKKDYSPSGIRLLQIANVSFGQVVWEQQNFLPNKFAENYPELILRENDIVMALNRPILNDLLKIARLQEVDSPAILYQRVARFNFLLDEMQDYFFHYTNSPDFIHLIRENLQGSDQPYINTTTLPTLPIPLPPLNEQKRIVAKIEELRDRSQRAKQALDAIPALCDRFRQSVLAAAFRGDLTADWREENPDVEPAAVLLERIRGLQYKQTTELSARELPETWAWAPFSEVAEIKSNLVNPIDYLDYPHIAPNHIVSGTGKLLEFTTVREDKVTSPKHLFEPGQILYSKIRPYLAKAVLIDFSGLCSADMYPVNTIINPCFLHQWMICPEFTAMASGQQGRTVLPKINQVALNQLLVPVPPIEEQAEIVERLNSYLEVIQLVNRYSDEDLSTRLNYLNQSILAKAFRGELVEQDPNDEPAAVLLERIRAERQAQTGKIRGARGRRKQADDDQLELL